MYPVPDELIEWYEAQPLGRKLELWSGYLRVKYTDMSIQIGAYLLKDCPPSLRAFLVMSPEERMIRLGTSLLDRFPFLRSLFR